MKQFRKEYKYSLGAELEKIIWQILDEIVEANSSPDTEKKVVIQRISGLFDNFKIRFRFAYEIGLIDSGKFGVAQKDMGEIGKMIGGWQKWAENK